MAKIVAGLGCAGLLLWPVLWLAFWGTVFYIVLHFIGKYW